MNLTIITPHSRKIIDIAWLEVNTSAGNFVIQRGHEPMIVTLSPSQPFTVCLRNGKQEIITSLHGILEINREQALLILSETV